MSLLESLIIKQLEKQVSALQEQTKAYDGWFESEKNLIDKFIINECFSSGELSDFWEGFLVRIFDSLLDIKGKWAVFAGMCANEGLCIGNRVLRCTVPITLKSLAIEVKLDLKLSNNSELWVLTRGEDIFDPSGCIVKIQKESDVDGTFVIFGSYIGNDGEFVFFKRQQIPEESEGSETVDVEMRIKDNGDDRVFVSVRMSSMKNLIFQTYCNKFLPYFKEAHLTLMGIGRSVVVKKVSVQQKERTNLGVVVEASRRQHCCVII